VTLARTGSCERIAPLAIRIRGASRIATVSGNQTFNPIRDVMRFPKTVEAISGYDESIEGIVTVLPRLRAALAAERPAASAAQVKAIADTLLNDGGISNLAWLGTLHGTPNRNMFCCLVAMARSASRNAGTA
jgi:hypothetical protein